MIKCCLFSVKDMDDPAAHPEWQPLFSEKRWSRIRSYAPGAVTARKECAGAGLLLNWVLAREGIPDGEKGVFYGENEKPRHRDIHFNLSHSSGQVICAVSDHNIGCDIQEHTAFKDHLLKKICAPEEYRILHTYSDPGERSVKATELWAMKESVLKLTGTGILKPMTDICIDLPLGNHDFFSRRKLPEDGGKLSFDRSGWSDPGCFRVQVDRKEIRERVFLYRKEDFALSICASKSPLSIEEVNLTMIMNEGII